MAQLLRVIESLSRASVLETSKSKSHFIDSEVEDDTKRTIT